MTGKSRLLIILHHLPAREFRDPEFKDEAAGKVGLQVKAGSEPQEQRASGIQSASHSPGRTLPPRRLPAECCGLNVSPQSSCVEA